MRILIVDDNKVSLSLLENLLKNNAYEVVSAENGAEALHSIGEWLLGRRKNDG